MLEKLIPRELGFFDLFERHINKTLDGIITFGKMLEDFTEIAGKVRRIEEIEHECDSIVHLTKELLRRTFITPIDRDDIQNLISKMDDVMDYIYATAQRLLLFEIKEVFVEFTQMVKVLANCIEQVQKSIFNLKSIKNRGGEILKFCVEIHYLENEGDELFRVSLARLFKENHPPLYIMKWKEILENIEKAIDVCEDIADVVNGIVIEHQ